MACVTPSGELTASGRTILEILVEPADVQRVAEATGLPVFRTRAALREFLAAGLARDAGGGLYQVTDLGRTRLQA